MPCMTFLVRSIELQRLCKMFATWVLGWNRRVDLCIHVLFKIFSWNCSFSHFYFVSCQLEEKTGDLEAVQTVGRELLEDQAQKIRDCGQTVNKLTHKLTGLLRTLLSTTGMKVTHEYRGFRKERICEWFRSNWTWVACHPCLRVNIIEQGNTVAPDNNHSLLREWKHPKKKKLYKLWKSVKIKDERNL